MPDSRPHGNARKRTEIVSMNAPAGLNYVQYCGQCFSFGVIVAERRSHPRSGECARGAERWDCRPVRKLVRTEKRRSVNWGFQGQHVQSRQQNIDIAALFKVSQVMQRFLGVIDVRPGILVIVIVIIVMVRDVFSVFSNVSADEFESLTAAGAQ